MNKQLIQYFWWAYFCDYVPLRKLVSFECCVIINFVPNVNTRDEDCHFFKVDCFHKWIIWRTTYSIILVDIFLWDVFFKIYKTNKRILWTLGINEWATNSIIWMGIFLWHCSFKEVGQVWPLCYCQFCSKCKYKGWRLLLLGAD
jgi:hypothetical protein